MFEENEVFARKCFFNRKSPGTKSNLPSNTNFSTCLFTRA
jgi:hypothetical protein